MKQIILKPNTLYKCELEGNEFYVKLDINEVRLLYDGHLHHIEILEEIPLIKPTEKITKILKLGRCRICKSFWKKDGWYQLGLKHKNAVFNLCGKCFNELREVLINWKL